MTEKLQPDVPNKVKEAVIFKAFYGLKIKTGPGGFDPMNVKKAERRMKNAVHLFPQVASGDIALVEEMLEKLSSDNVLDQHAAITLHENIIASIVELKAHSTMFQFPLVTEILENLLPFCLTLTHVTPLACEVITEHFRALKVAIDQGPRAITPQDHKDLLLGLKQAVAKVLRNQ